jgi:hypothetical protein
MKRRTRSHHFDAAYLSLLNQKRFSKQDARWAVESVERKWPSVGQDTRVDRALIDHAVRPHDTSFLIDNGIAASMDALDDEVITQLELRHTVHREGINRIRGEVRTRRRARRR